MNIKLAFFVILTTLAINADWGDDSITERRQGLLDIDGTKYIDEVCKYEEDSDGSFRLFGKRYFIYFRKNKDGTGYADWNESPDSSHAHTPLGNFVENDGCWVDINRSISICVREVGK